MMNDAFGYEGNVPPEGYVSEETHAELEQANLALRRSLRHAHDTAKLIRVGIKTDTASQLEGRCDQVIVYANDALDQYTPKQPGQTWEQAMRQEDFDDLPF